VGFLGLTQTMKRSRDEILFGKLKKGGKVEIDFNKNFIFKF
jgi:hypothetical protein